MEDASGKTVLMLLPRGGDLVSRMLDGVHRVAEARGWRFFPVECTRRHDSSVHLLRSPGGATVAEVVRFLQPDGCIVASGEVVPFNDLAVAVAHSARNPSSVMRPVVRLNRPRLGSDSAIPDLWVSCDSAACADMAARELLGSGFEHYAYLPRTGEDNWSAERGKEFKRCISMAGRTYHPFPRELSRIETDNLVSLCESWLATLPKPCGVFTANDAGGESLLRACERLGLDVPGQIAVVSVDDIETICEHTHPTLTSVRRDLIGEGAAAAELLAQWMDNPGRVPQSKAVPPVSLVRRSSTRFSSRLDRRVASAQEWIRLHACTDGFGPRDVVRAMGVSRATADRLFRSVAKHSILSEIHAVRIAQAKEKLRAGTIVDIAAAECGFASTLDFRRCFRRLEGVTVGKWKRMSCIV